MYNFEHSSREAGMWLAQGGIKQDQSFCMTCGVPDGLSDGPELPRWDVKSIIFMILENKYHSNILAEQS